MIFRFHKTIPHFVIILLMCCTIIGCSKHIQAGKWYKHRAHSKYVIKVISTDKGYQLYSICKHSLDSLRWEHKRERLEKEAKEYRNYYQLNDNIMQEEDSSYTLGKRKKNKNEYDISDWDFSGYKGHSKKIDTTIEPGFQYVIIFSQVDSVNPCVYYEDNYNLIITNEKTFLEDFKEVE